MNTAQSEPMLSFREALGAAVMSFNSLDLVTQLCVWVVIGGDYEEGRIVTAQMPFRTVVDVMCSLFKYRASSGEAMGAIDDIRRRLESAEEHRNRIAHAHWSEDPSSGLASGFKATARAKRGLQKATWKASPSDLLQLARDFEQLSNDMVRLIFDTPGVRRLDEPDFSSAVSQSELEPK